MNTTISGWLLDAYPIHDKMEFWIKQKDGTTKSLKDRWTHSIYAASDDRTTLNSILHTHKKISDLIRCCKFKSHYERLTDITKSDVLKLVLTDSTKALILASTIEELYNHSSFSKVRLYNVAVASTILLL